MSGLVSRFVSPVAALVTLLLPPNGPMSPATFAPSSARSTTGVATWQAPGSMPRPSSNPPSASPGLQWAAFSIAGCSRQIDGTDPLAVAASVAAWVFCGAGTPMGVSSHGWKVLLGWSALEFPARPATVLAVALLDPRTAPVVAEAEVARAADPTVHRVVLTLYRSSLGQWAVDDLIVVGG